MNVCWRIQSYKRLLVLPSVGVASNGAKKTVLGLLVLLTHICFLSLELIT